MKPSAKRSRAQLQEFTHGPHVSQRGLAHCLGRASAVGVPEHVSRSTISRARADALSDPTPYGPLITSMDFEMPDGIATVHVQNPLAMLHTACRKSGFRELFRHALARSPSTVDSPWNLIYYVDEIGISAHIGRDSRKTEASYWSFLEFGQIALCREAAWFTIAAIRSEIVHNAVGSLSNCARMLLLMFFGALGHDMRSGVFLPTGECMEPELFFATLGVITGDLDALRKILHAKGSSALKLCFDCQNVLNNRFPTSHLASDWTRWSTCLHHDQFVPHTDDSVREVLRTIAAAREELLAGRIPKTRLEEMEIHFGFVHVENGLLTDATLRAGISLAMTDWFHCYLQTGLFNYEFAILMMFLTQPGDLGPTISWESLLAFADSCTWPRVYSSPAHLLTKDNVGKNTFSFQCEASEALNLYPVIALFLDTMPTPIGREAPVASFLALCDVLDLLVSIRTMLTDPDLLEAAILTHLTKYQTAYGELNWVAKHHVVQHLAGKLRKFKTLISLFTCERHHKLVKRHMMGRTNLNNWEKGVIEEITVDHLYALEQPVFKEALLEPTEPRKKKRDELCGGRAPCPKSVLVSRKLSATTGETITVGDVALLRGGRLCKVSNHISFDGEVLSSVSLWVAAPCASDTRYCRRYRTQECHERIPSSHLLTSVIYLDIGEYVSALIPAPYR